MKIMLLIVTLVLSPLYVHSIERTYPFSLPPLGYLYSDLEPHIDGATMKVHYSKHHAGYVNNLNKALKDYPEFHSTPLHTLVKDWSKLPDPLKTVVRHNAGGHLNHSDFWLWMTPTATSIPEGLASVITATFGSIDGFKTQFKDEALKVFGSGWAWLCVDEEGSLVITSTLTQDNPLTESLSPILGLDVWEHAYYLKYQNRRPDYIDAWWNVVNWPRVALLYEKYSSKQLPHESGVIIIPGITGDLAKRKLVPALYESIKRGNQLYIIGTGRRSANVQELLATLKGFFKNIDEESLKKFESRFAYHKLDAKNVDDFKSLGTLIEQAVRDFKLGDLRVVYLSTPSESFCDYTKALVSSGVLVKGNERHRIAYEKPFGFDSASAVAIETCINAELAQEQIYHIDHYLAKPLIVSLPTLRADNEIFKEAWSNKTISSVVIRMNETIDIENRGYFYDEYGVLKDVIQNHGLQILAAILMNDTLSSPMSAKLTALSALRVTNVELGQYQGYTESEGVKKIRACRPMDA